MGVSGTTSGAGSGGEAGGGRRFGFEFVIFRAERGAFPVTWASHLALTDETAGLLGIPRETVRSRLRVAREQLRHELGEAE